MVCRGLLIGVVGWGGAGAGLYMRARLKEYCDGGFVREEEGRSLLHGAQEDACLLPSPPGLDGVCVEGMSGKKII
jgi:hypothetical protein